MADELRDPGWSAAGLPLDAQRVRSAYEQVRSTLVDDPLFAENAADFHVSVAELDRRMAKPPGRLDGGTLWDWLDGADQYRWAGLWVVAQAYASPITHNLAGRVTVSGNQTYIATGDVVIEGDLVLDEETMVVVLGTLTVTGALVAAPGYSMVAAAEITCRDGVSAGEVLALRAIRCPGTFYLGHNDYSCRAPLYRGGVLVDFERGNAFGRVEVAERITDWDFPAAAQVLGVSGDTDLLPAYAAKLLGTGTK